MYCYPGSGCYYSGYRDYGAGSLTLFVLLIVLLVCLSSSSGTGGYYYTRRETVVINHDAEGNVIGRTTYVTEEV